MSKAARQARLAELQAAQRKTDRRRRRLIILIAVIVAAALVIPTAVIITGEQRRQAARDEALQAAVTAPLPGVVEEPEQDASHVRDDVDYGTSRPPMGGPHDPVWQDCGFYDAPVRNENVVHSLEHGAVWVTYSETLADDDVAALRSLAGEHSYLLVSPYPGLSGPLVATAWGVQLELDGVDDDRLEVFIARYLQGPQTPEPGAACSGGTSATL